MLDGGNLRAGSLKPSVTQTGFATDSRPLAEQAFLVSTIDRLQNSPYWKEKAIRSACDDCDGWYDHVMSPMPGYRPVSERNSDSYNMRH